MFLVPAPVPRRAVGDLAALKCLVRSSSLGKKSLVLGVVLS